MRVYCCHHRAYPNLAEDISYIKAIQGGAAVKSDAPDILNETPPGFLRDDFGEGAKEISLRNPYWSELTVHHWIWRNSLDELMGVCHYRRFFSPFSREELGNKLGVDAHPYLYMADQEIKDILALDPLGENLFKKFETVDIILPTPTLTQKSMDEMYFDVHPATHWNTMRKVFQEMYPVEWRSAYRFFECNEVFFRHIMFIGRRSYIVAFYDWLFPLLFELEKQLVFSHNEIDHQRRAVAFLAERMFNWWLHSRPVAQAFVPLLFPIEAGAMGGAFRRETLDGRRRITEHFMPPVKKEPFTLSGPENTMGTINPDQLQNEFKLMQERNEKNLARFLGVQPQSSIKFGMKTSLDLGCGKTTRNPFEAKTVFGVDMATPDVEYNIVYADLNVNPIPFPQEFFNYVTAFDLIEHIPRVIVDNGKTLFPFVNLMREIYRVLAPDGVFLSSTPAFPSPESFVDPTHVNYITELTFPLYFCGQNPWGSELYGFEAMFELISQERQGSHLLTLMKKAEPNKTLELRPVRDEPMAFSNNTVSSYYDSSKTDFSPINKFTDEPGFA